MSSVDPVGRWAARGDIFHVAFVCTGNRARSPLAEALLARRAASLPVLATSAGTLGPRGLPPLPGAIKAGRRLGVDIGAHRSRPLDDIALDTADLVLGFEPAHVRAVVRAGASEEQTYLLGELVALVAPSERTSDPVGLARAVVSTAHERRRRVPAPATATVADPLGMPTRVMQATADEIEDLVGRLFAGLFGQGPSGSIVA